jgi:hypothetical protein
MLIIIQHCQKPLNEGYENYRIFRIKQFDFEKTVWKDGKSGYGNEYKDNH